MEEQTKTKEFFYYKNCKVEIEEKPSTVDGKECWGAVVFYPAVTIDKAQSKELLIKKAKEWADGTINFLDEAFDKFSKEENKKEYLKFLYDNSTKAKRKKWNKAPSKF